MPEASESTGNCSLPVPSRCQHPRYSTVVEHLTRLGSAAAGGFAPGSINLPQYTCLRGRFRSISHDDVMTIQNINNRRTHRRTDMRMSGPESSA